MRDLTPGDLVVPDVDHPNDIRTVESITITKFGIKVWTNGSRSLTQNPVPVDTEIEVADPAPSFLTSWCASESTWYINVNTNSCNGVRMSLSLDDRLVYDGQNSSASGKNETMVRIRQRWIRAWRQLAVEASETEESNGFADGVNAVLSFLDEGTVTPQLGSVLKLVSDEKCG